jgi:hypothetical protein
MEQQQDQMVQQHIKCEADRQNMLLRAESRADRQNMRADSQAENMMMRAESDKNSLLGMTAVYRSRRSNPY